MQCMYNSLKWVTLVTYFNEMGLFLLIHKITPIFKSGDPMASLVNNYQPSYTSFVKCIKGSYWRYWFLTKLLGIIEIPLVCPSLVL